MTRARTTIRLALAALLSVGVSAAAASAQQPTAAAAGDTVTTATGLRFVFLQRGSGARPARGDVMVIHGIGRFTDGREFWNTRTDQRPYEYRFMTDRVIRGFEEGMRHVRAGDRIEIIMTPDLAYGERGNRDIPPNATLVFDYEILEIRAAPRPQPLGEADRDDIARLLMLEDRREWDDAALARLLRAPHPEVRRRAAQSIGRINDPAGRALLATMRSDADTAVAATVVFATGQLHDSAAVPWLASLLHASATPATVAREAARSLGKIRTPAAHAALARYLADAPASTATAPVVGEALLAIGRFATREDVTPVVRWTTSPDNEVRWRAAWALFRPRNPAAVPHLLPLAEDANAEVRFWALRGLAPALADTAGVPRERSAARLRDALRDADRRVRTEALRTLVLYDDDASLAAVLDALDSDDSWLYVSAAEALGRFTDRAHIVAPRLIAAAAEGRPLSLRLSALTSLVTLAPDAALELASSLAREPGEYARSAGIAALRRLGEPGAARLEALGLARPGAGGNAAAAQQLPSAQQQRAEPVERTHADYRALVDRWVVPDYEGAPRPRALWDTPRGTVEIELYPGDAPLATDYFVQLVESGDIVGTEFGRVVPNFVAQQRTVAGARTLRDEVNRLGLTRGNLSWASSGLDTGRPGYTLGSTPQPHNEGDFTALGRVVRGLDVVDRLELGDRVTGARMLR